MTRFREEPERHFVAGFFLCPVTKREVPLETLVPGPWVEWPVTLQCPDCHNEHQVQYEDILHREPAFGHE